MIRSPKAPSVSSQSSQWRKVAAVKKSVAIIDEELIINGCVTVVTRVGSVAEAEQWIAARMAIDPDKVIRGGYGIDA